LLAQLVLATFPVLAPGAGDTDAARELARIAKLAPGPACVQYEALLARRELSEDARRGALTGLRDRAIEAAPPLSAVELALIEELKAKSLPVVEPLASRYVILLGGEEFVANARENKVPGLLDAAYVVQRQLFAVDPVQLVGHRYVFFPEATKPGGWTIWSGNLTIAYGNASAKQGTFDENMAHELSHAFTARTAGQHLISRGFGEGWSDLAIAYTAERLSFLGPEMAALWTRWRDGILNSGDVEYVTTRLPIEEIVAYGPSVAPILRLCIDSPARRGDVDWAPLAKMFREQAEAPPPWMPAYLWSARMARDLLRTFPGDRTWDTLSRFRFPLDPGSQKEIDVWAARARQKPYPPRAEQWKADGQTVARTWRVLGPIPVPKGRWANVDFDPGDAWNFQDADQVEFGGATYRWRTDVPVDADGIVQLGSLPGSDGPCVFYLRTDLPPEAEGSLALFAASDDECAVWVDGTQVDLFRGERGTNPDEPDRVFARVAKGGGKVLAQVANYAGPTGFHLRWSKGTAFETAWRVEMRAPDPRRRQMAVRRLGTLRMSFDLVAAMLVDALSDGKPEVRSEAARLLAGKRGEASALEALIAAWSREKDPRVLTVLQAAVHELALRVAPDAAAARRWWRDEGRAWRESDYVEAELAYSLRSAFGGSFENHAGAYGGQHVGHCFGGEPAHALNLVLEVHQSGPHVMAVRYASADGERRADLRVRRGEQPVAARDGAVFPKTRREESWTWQEVPLGVLPPGRYRVEIGNLDGCLDLDVIGLRLARP